MAAHPEKLTIAPASWGPDVAAWLDRARGAASLADLEAQAGEGGRVFAIMADGETVGAFLLRVDQTADGPEGVIVAAAAELAGIDMVASCLPGIEALFVDVRAIRYHTARPALARRLAGLGYAPAELVCRKTIEA